MAFKAIELLKVQKKPMEGEIWHAIWYLILNDIAK